MSTETPLITTIIPTYRRPQLLRRAIQSVLNQTYPHFEVRIYDNASGDETAAVVAEFAKCDARVKYHCHPENIGMVANFNYGLERVDTPLFSILSDDDVLLPNFYEDQLSAFNDYPDIAFAAGSVIEMTQDGQVVRVPLHDWAKVGYFAPPDGFLELLNRQHPTITGILFNTERIGALRLLDPSIAMSDVDLELQIASQFPFVVSKSPVAIFLSHAASSGKQSTVIHWWDEYHKVIEKLTTSPHLPPLVVARSRQIMLRDLQAIVYGMGIRAAVGGDLKEARHARQLLEQHYSFSYRNVVLAVVMFGCDKSDVAYRMFALAYRSLKAAKHRLKSKQHQAAYGMYQIYLR